MSGNSQVVNLVRERGNRAIATILSCLEDDLYTRVDVPNQVRASVRTSVMAAINDFKDFAMDVVKSDGAVINEEWAGILVDIHDSLRRIESTHAEAASEPGDQAP